MLEINAAAIAEMDKTYRLNLINSITGYKSAQLIGTQNNAGATNLAVFSSVIHLGSNPPLVGFILRPTTVPRHTFANLKETGVFTLNHISAPHIEDAHHTSANTPKTSPNLIKHSLPPFTKRDGKHLMLLRLPYKLAVAI